MGWRWVSLKTAMDAHQAQLDEHGGGEGVRDLRLLESAMARPQNLAAYGDPDAADLAAAYAYGIARNHPFVDGSKRTALVVSISFLRLNGFAAAFDIDAITRNFELLAAGELSEPDLAAWFRERLA